MVSFSRYSGIKGSRGIKSRRVRSFRAVSEPVLRRQRMTTLLFSVHRFVKASFPPGGTVCRSASRSSAAVFGQGIAWIRSATQRNSFDEIVQFNEQTGNVSVGEFHRFGTKRNLVVSNTLPDESRKNDKKNSSTTNFGNLTIAAPICAPTKRSIGGRRLR